MVLAKITKQFVRGILVGHKIEERMSFASVRLAEDWFDAINRQCERGYVGYRVVDMKIIRS